MAGLGAFLAAGAAAGIGNGLVAQAKLDFEAAKQKAALEARAKERAEDRDFQMKRDETNFGQQLKLKDIDNTNANARLDRTEKTQAEREAERRKYEADEKQKDRDERAARDDGDLLSGDDGTAYRAKGAKAEPIVGPDGKPVRGLGVKKEYDSEAQRRLRERDQQKDFLDAIKEGKDEFGSATDINKVVSGWRDRKVPLDSPDVARKTRELLVQEALRSGLKGDAVEAHIAKRSAELGIGGTTEPQMKPNPGGGAVEPKMQRKPPAEYPDARWSEKAGGWVVQQNGKWFKVE